MATEAPQKRRPRNPNTPPPGKNYENFFKGKTIVIADPTAGARINIAAVLKSFGAKTSTMSLVSGYAAALDEIRSVRPHIIVTDYNLDESCGLRLRDYQREILPGAKDSVFVLVTANSRESVIAEAAEEDVDAYILKPFTGSVLIDQLSRAIESKLNPSSYRQVIDEGKSALVQKDADTAKGIFRKAVGLSERPSLAHYYYGQACMMKTELPAAEKSYSEGLRVNELHYRCLVGLFDVFQKEHKYLDAYEVANKIAIYFPLSPQRLEEILRLSVITKTFYDIDGYYDIFTQLDYRTSSLVKVMASALVVAGMYHLKQNEIPKGAGLFKKAIIISGRTSAVLREIIISLVAHGAYEEADSFVKEYPPEQHADPGYLAVEYLVSDGIEPIHRTIVKGRKLVKDGVRDPLIYEVLIARSVEADFADSAEVMTHEACSLWPQMAKRFRALLQNKA